MNKSDLDRQAWLEQQLGAKAVLHAVTGGASFRQFFRFQHQGSTYILMDVTRDDLVACRQYVELTSQFTAIGIRVPKVYAANLDDGWVWMEDVGDARLDTVLSPENADEIYQKLMGVIATLQRAELKLPIFGREAMAFAMQGFQSWFLEEWLGLHFSTAEQAVLNDAYDGLIEQALSQAQRPMHRDYHCQNVLLLPDRELAIIDFQDAKIGPVTYDLASCLRDCYIDWPEQQVRAWMQRHYQHLCDDQIIRNISLDHFTQWFDWMGIERHLKACFTFIRKKLRDNDTHYMQYIPRTLNYIEQVSANYRELSAFHELLVASILPQVARKGVMLCERP